MSLAAPVARVSEAVATADVARVEAVIDEVFRVKMRGARAYGQEATDLWRTASETVRGGKLVRPRLLLAAYRELAGMPHTPRSVIQAAAAVELLHYAFILHDDVIDGDTVRRGRPNLIGAIAADAAPARRALHRGTTAAILMGDLVLSAAYQLLARLDVPERAPVRVFDVVDHTIDQTVAGEWADVTFAHGMEPPTLNAILEMSANKTACYTFELPLRLAAVLADAALPTENALATAGRYLGIAFQLDDDLLCAFGDPAEHGKDPLSDLREGKQTPIIAFARTTSEWRLITDRVGRSDLTPEEADRVREVLVACGAKDYVESLRDDAIAQVRRLCRRQRHIFPGAAGNVLLEFAAQLEGRRT